RAAPHPRGGREALWRHPRAHPPDRVEDAGEAPAPPPLAEAPRVPRGRLRRLAPGCAHVLSATRPRFRGSTTPPPGSSRRSRMASPAPAKAPTRPASVLWCPPTRDQSPVLSPDPRRAQPTSPYPEPKVSVPSCASLVRSTKGPVKQGCSPT